MKYDSLSLSLSLAVGLEEDSKWSVHYTTQKSQREHVYLTGARPLGVTDDLQSVLRGQRSNLRGHCGDRGVTGV